MHERKRKEASHEANHIVKQRSLHLDLWNERAGRGGNQHTGWRNAQIFVSSLRYLCCSRPPSDKANRSSISSFRGPGMQAGLRQLEELRQQLQVPVITDIHEPWQAEPVAQVVDVLQIPCIFCADKQTCFKPPPTLDDHCTSRRCK